MTWQGPLCGTLSLPRCGGHWKRSWPALASGLQANFIFPPQMCMAHNKRGLGTRAGIRGTGGAQWPQPGYSGKVAQKSTQVATAGQGLSQAEIFPVTSAEPGWNEPAAGLWAGSAHSALPKLLPGWHQSAPPSLQAWLGEPPARSLSSSEFKAK